MEIGRNNPRIEGSSRTHGAQQAAANEMSTELKTSRDKVEVLAKQLSFGAGKPPTFTPGKDPKVANFVKSRL
ncbi:MAG: hypothetical protein K2P51_01545 [Rhabdochlamydiaceae bacterium]|nr:hypothetical protein [Rhabdochlamydiaceae bacterium]